MKHRILWRMKPVEGVGGMKKMNMLIKILLLCFLMLGFGIGAEAKTRQKAEMYYDYEIKTGENGSCYAVIKGFREEYRKDIDETLHGLIGNSWNISFPEKLGGAKVMGFAANAFQNVPLGDYSGHLQLSGDIVFVGAHCFENCGLTDVVFEKNNLTGKDFLETLVVDDGAFAHNPELWGIYFRDREIVLGNGIWEGCGEEVYLCYMSGEEGAGERGEYLEEYARENRLNRVEIPAYYSDMPMVDVPEIPWVLKPEVRNFFYGENGESTQDEDRFCTFEYGDDAPDYGFPEWHVVCGEFCAMSELKYEITASSELASVDGRYAAKNLGHIYTSREKAWAEGVEGWGIGESISITEACGYSFWERNIPEREVSFLAGDLEPDIYDGYIRYTEICVVNGYAKNQKAWEENGRVKRLLMYVEDKPYACLELEDTIYPQYFKLPTDAIKAAQGVDVHFRFVIEDVYKGTKYEDTCLTGLIVDFMGRRGH